MNNSDAVNMVLSFSPVLDEYLRVTEREQVLRQQVALYQDILSELLDLDLSPEEMKQAVDCAAMSIRLSKQ